MSKVTGNAADCDGDSNDNGESVIELGAFVRDEVHEKVCIVVETTEIRADQYEIPALGGKTVAGRRTNQEYPATDLVVKVVYVESVREELGSANPKVVVEAYEQDRMDAAEVQVYSIPESRAKPVGR